MRARTEASRYWRREDLEGLELLAARFHTHAYRPHAHPGYVIAVITGGAEAVTCGGTLHRAGPGQIIFVNPEEIHDGQRASDDGWAYRVFYPSLPAVRAVAADGGTAKGTPYFPQTVVHDPALAARLIRLHAVLEDGRDSLEAQSMWIEILDACVARHASSSGRRPPGGRDPARIRRVRDMIETRCDEPLSLDDLAREAQVSPSHLIRLFKAETGVSPHAFMITCRVRRARALMDQREDAARAAVAAGFVDQSHFMRHFKSTFGFTPGQYMAAHGHGA